MEVSFSSPYVNAGFAQNISVVPRKNVRFTGSLGDGFVKNIQNVKPEDVIPKIRGTFGFSADRIQDVLESFIHRLQRLETDNKAKRAELARANETIKSLREEMENAVAAAIASERNHIDAIVERKDSVILNLKKELNEAQEYAAKYEPFSKVKSVEEIGTIMPDKAIEIMDEIVEHRVEAYDSMFDFLMHGHGQNMALSQLNRQSMLYKAYQDGIMNIPNVADRLESTYPGNYKIRIAPNYSIALNMIEDALLGNPKGEYIESKVIKEQVKKNAMALLTPMADNRFSNATVSAFEEELDEILSNVDKFHRGYSAGLKKIVNKYPNADISVEQVPYDLRESKVKIAFPQDSDEIDMNLDFWQLSNIGNSNY